MVNYLPECSRRWFFRFVCLLNPRWQTWHLNGQVPVCTYVWDLRSPGVGKDLEHIVHLCGFSWKNVKKEKRYLKELCFCFLFKRGREIIQYWSQLSHVSSIFLTLKVDNEWYRNRRLATARKRPLSHKKWHFCYKTRIPCGFHIQVVEIWRRIYICKTLTIFSWLMHEINFYYISFSDEYF